MTPKLQSYYTGIFHTTPYSLYGIKSIVCDTHAKESGLHLCSCVGHLHEDVD